MAPNISYHAPKAKGMTRGVAVRLPLFIDYIDKHEIAHASAGAIRKMVKRERKSAPRMKQYFLKKGVVVVDSKISRINSVCKGCLCIPEEMTSDDFQQTFVRG